MEYRILGTVMPVVEITLQRGEVLKSQAGAMKWMNESINMSTNMDGGVGGFLKRSLMGESGFLNFFEATKEDAKIAFGHSFPGNIVAVDVSRQSIICQRRAFLCSTSDVEMEITFQKRLGTGFFGGEGFIMQRLSGSGIAFVEIDGEAIELELKTGEAIKVETGAVGMYESTVTMDIEAVKGFKNVLFGGEGLFLTRLQGPGRVWIQTMGIQSLAGELIPFLPRPSSK